MNILARAVDIASILDPSLGLELEDEFGNDWRKELDSEIENFKCDNEASKIAAMTVKELREHFEGTEAIEYAKQIGAGEHRNENQATKAIFDFYQKKKK